MIYLDGEKVAAIANGESQTLITPPGPHQIRVKLDWFSSPVYKVFTIKDHVHVFNIDQSKTSLRLLGMEIILALHFILLLFYDFNKLIIFMFPFLMVELYFLTFGRNKYFKLKKIEGKLDTNEAQFYEK